MTLCVLFLSYIKKFNPPCYCFVRHLSHRYSCLSYSVHAVPQTEKMKKKKFKIVFHFLALAMAAGYKLTTEEDAKGI